MYHDQIVKSNQILLCSNILKSLHPMSGEGTEDDLPVGEGKWAELSYLASFTYIKRQTKSLNW